MRKNPYSLRCYARPEGDYILGICVDVDIAVRGHSVAEVKREMAKALTVYFESLDAKNIAEVFPRKVPVSVMADYYKVCISIHMFKARKNIQVFCEQLIPKEFTICPASA